MIRNETPPPSTHRTLSAISVSLPKSFMTIWRTVGTFFGSLRQLTAWRGMVVSTRTLNYLRRRNSERAHVSQSIDIGIRPRRWRSRPNGHGAVQ